MTAREEILRRVDGIVPRPPDEPDEPDEDVAAAYAALDRSYLRRHHDEAIVALFAERAADYRATVEQVTSTALPAAIAAALAERPGRYGIPEGLPAGWLAGCEPDRLAHAPGDLEQLAGAVTGCAVAIAETGTVVLDHGPAQGPRALTLIPDHHLIVVRADQIAPDVPEALERLGMPARPLTFVSGPSATSDIELARVEGVHGPRALEILILT